MVNGNTFGMRMCLARQFAGVWRYKWQDNAFGDTFYGTGDSIIIGVGTDGAIGEAADSQYQNHGIIPDVIKSAFKFVWRHKWQAIARTDGTYSYNWIGARRDPIENHKFVWHDGKTKWEYAPWRRDGLQPDDYQGKEKCVEMDWGSAGSMPSWNDLPCWEKLEYICEREYCNVED
ncbi:hypothetical protein Y032_0006g3026 [Ancylostoma ceylanicum]|nr:hypothetical protein Y032_0006g3026 [Ancylostoma ceylanicum]